MKKWLEGFEPEFSLFADNKNLLWHDGEEWAKTGCPQLLFGSLVVWPATSDHVWMYMKDNPPTLMLVAIPEQRTDRERGVFESKNYYKLGSWIAHSYLVNVGKWEQVPDEDIIADEAER
jgi:hypothetical protein